MIEIQHKICPVCKKDVPYTDVRSVPKTCGSKMCVANWNAHINRMTPEGDSPSIERLGTWNSYQNLKK